MAKIRVLWFEVSTPCRYSPKVKHTAGWQDSLEDIVRENSDIELFIAFESDTSNSIRVVDGVTYLPIVCKYNIVEKVSNYCTWNNYKNKIVSQSIRIIRNLSPDIIHVFGTEWPFGLVAKYTDIPVVVHIQGAIIPYNNSMYPPCYSHINRVKYAGLNLAKQGMAYLTLKKDLSRAKMEVGIWNCVKYYMGRTCWDKAVSGILHPSCKYFHVDEALRNAFLSAKRTWECPMNERFKIITTGCSSFWKGPDMLLKVAVLLKKIGVKFEWQVAGVIPQHIKKIVETKENSLFNENNVQFLGFIDSETLIDKMLDSNVYVHTAYIENSPNSICEAQILGIPIVSTNVGGIASLIEDKVSGFLVPANDPWQMAYAIITILKDRDLQKRMSSKSILQAKNRHDPVRIYSDLLYAYKSIIAE